MRDKSYGIIPLRKRGEDFETLLVQLHAGHWGFPKGHAEDGETDKEAAARELFEETSLTVVEFLPFKGVSESYVFRYQGDLIYKDVFYFLALVEGKLHTQKEEIKDAKWFPLSEAAENMTFKEGKKIAEKIYKLLYK
jgi:8-oxo-dGTP pyrophosphatase MutT (NUDIX family)